jgi:hypothetical protein
MGFEPGWTKYLHTWGEAGTVSLKEKKHPKVKNKGVTMMFVGYPDNHSADTFNMWDPTTQRTHKTRDVIFLNRMYYAPSPDIRAGEGPTGNSFEALSSNEDDEDNEAEDNADDANSVMSNDSGSIPDPGAGEGNITTRSGRIVRNVERLTYDVRGNPRQEFNLVGAGLGGGFVNTQELHVMKYDEAMATPDAKEWEKAVDKEHERMVNSSVFKATPLDEVPDDATILTETWAMKKKANGIFRARVTARGYEQIDGEHFDSTEIAAPVVAEMTIHILFILIMMALLHAQLMDVIGAFLLGHFNPKHKMYMRVPRGFEKFYPPGVVLLLERTLYGTRQAAMAFW